MRRKHHDPSRRRLLRGALAGGGLVWLGLPALEIFRPRVVRAEDSLFPRRFGLFFWGNGNLPDRWTPAGEGYGWTPSEQLAPLSAHRDVISVVTGMSAKVDVISPHWSGAAGLLTGQQVLGDDGDWTVGAPTIDQLIAASIGGDTLYRSLEIGVGTDEIFCYSGPNAPIPGETDPLTLYARLFGDTFRAPGEDGIVDPSLGFRRSVLDAVMDDLGSLQRELGQADRDRLEQHLTGVRELELRLARLEEDPPDYASCARPTQPPEDFPDIDGRPQLRARSLAMAELLAMALACDQTRVFSFHFSRPLNNMLFENASDGHHNLTHNEGGDQPEVHDITLQIMESFADLLDVLRAVPEGDGTLLDHCLVLGASEHSEGRTHSVEEMPLLIAGGNGEVLKTGYHHRSYTRDNASKVMLSLVRAMGVIASDFGEDDARATEGLSELEV